MTIEEIKEEIIANRKKKFLDTPFTEKNKQILAEEKLKSIQNIAHPTKILKEFDSIIDKFNIKLEIDDNEKDSIINSISQQLTNELMSEL